MIGVLEPVLRFFMGFYGNLLDLADRYPSDSRLESYLKSCQGSADLNHVVFYCSSAGEYEQAVPLIRRFTSRGYDPVIFFFSRSGYRFAKVRNEPSPFFLSPLDRKGHWHNIFDQLSVRKSFLVRHEFWPSFLMVAASEEGGVSLINASPSLRDRQSRLSRCVKKAMLKFFHRIYVVSEADFKFFTKYFAVSSDKLLIAGDSKYDRVYERSQEALNKGSALEKVAYFQHGPEPFSRLIVGSAWEPDYKVALSALSVLRSHKFKHYVKPELIIALHEPSEEALLKLESACQVQGFASVRFSQLAAEGAKRSEDSGRPCPAVVLIDSVGLLSELYSLANLAMVGGGLHHKIHNVLEPACYGLPLAFGPRYKNSGEAILMVDDHCATIVESGKELAGWWIRQAESDHKDGQKVSDHLKGYLGATDKIMCDLLREQADDVR